MKLKAPDADAATARSSVNRFLRICLAEFLTIMSDADAQTISFLLQGWAAASRSPDENDCSSSNKHALAIQSLDKLRLKSAKTPSGLHRRGKSLRAGRPGSSHDNALQRIECAAVLP